MDTPEASDSNSTDEAGSPGRTILGRFRVEKILGHGGMGEVLLAEDTLLHRRVALKRLRSDDEEGSKHRRAILKEARRASQVSDRRIAAIYDVVDLGNELLIVMEFVPGSTLRERMRGPIPVGEFWDLSSQCVGAVGAAHAHGVIHRDIKPENLMVTQDGLIKILDFGIAGRAETPEGASSPSTTTMTSEERRGVVVGTPPYMAPEAHYGGRIDQRTDIFSLGAMFYELLTSQHPFAAPTYGAVVERIMNSVPPAVHQVNPTVGPLLSGVIAKMIAKDPEQRYASCDELQKSLDEARHLEPLGGTPQPATAPRAAARFTIRWPAVAAAAIALAAGVAAWGLWRGSFGAGLPRDRHLAVLAPLTPGASDEFAGMALGSIDLLAARLQKHQAQPGFQLASFQEGLDEKVASIVEARKILGANLALVPTLEQRTDVFRARLDLWDAARGRVVASRIAETPLSQPFAFLDHLYSDAVDLLGLTAGGRDAASEYGVRGAGTLRFLLQGIGRMRNTTTEEQARRAADDLELACKTEPDAAAARAWLAAAQRKCYLLGKDRAWLDLSKTSAREAIGRDSSRAEPYRVLGMVLALEGDAPGARAAFARACAINPTDDDTYSRLGRMHGQLGEPEKERETYLAAIASRPHCWQPYWWLATWHFRRGQVGESIQAYEQMVRHSPDLYRGYSYLGGLLVLNGDYERAIDTLRHSLTLRPTKVAFDNLGTAYFNSGRLVEAIGAYNQSFQFGFAEYDSWLNLGDAYFWLPERRDQASAAYAQSIRLGRERMRSRSQQGQSFDVMIPANLATVFPKLGEPDSARAYLRQALDADSANTMVQFCAGLVHWQLAERTVALTWIERAVQNGYPLAWLRDSPVFQEWRSEERFRALIAGAAPQTPQTTSPG